MKKLPKQIKLPEDVGAARKGDIFIRGLHRTPDYYGGGPSVNGDWYWKKGSEKNEHKFLHINVIRELLTPNPQPNEQL